MEGEQNRKRRMEFEGNKVLKEGDPPSSMEQQPPPRDEVLYSISDTKLDELIYRQRRIVVTVGPKLPDKGKTFKANLKRYQDEKERRKNLPLEEEDDDYESNPQTGASNRFRQGVATSSPFASLFARKSDVNMDGRTVNAFEKGLSSELAVKREVNNTSKISPCHFEHLWVRLNLGMELEDILKDYSRLDATPFEELVGMEIELIRDAIVLCLGRTLHQVSRMSLEEIESKLLSELERPFIALEKHGIRCPYIIKRLAIAHRIKPSEASGNLTDFSKQYELSMKELIETSVRKEAIEKDLEALNRTMQQLITERDTALARIETLRKKISEVKSAKEQTLEGILEHLPGSDPVVVLLNTRNFLFPPP